jgi:hypothetical protein
MADVQAISDAISARLPLILPTLAALLAVVLLQNVLSRRPLANIPVVGQDLGGDEKRRQAYLVRAADMYVEGYKKVGSLCGGSSTTAGLTNPPVQKQCLQDCDVQQ